MTSVKLWKMCYMSSEFQSSQALRECQWSSTTPVAHLRHQFVLLEQDQLPHDQWLFHQIHHCMETSQTVPHMLWSKNSEWYLLNLANHLCWEVTMDLATVPRSSRSSLNSIKCTTSWAAHTIQRAMVLLRLLWASQIRLMEKAIKDGKPWNYELLQYRVTLISSTIPSLLEALTRWRLRASLPQIPSLIGRTIDSSRICQELIKRQPSTLTRYGMDLESRTTSICQGSARKHLEDSNHQSTYQRTRFLLGKVSWQLNPEKDCIRWLNPRPNLLIWNWRLRAMRGTYQNKGPPATCRVSRQCSLSQNSKPFQQANWLHKHCMNHPHHQRGRTLWPVH